MTDWMSAPWSLPLLAVAVLLIAWLVWKRFFARGTPLEEALADIAFERIEHLVVPSADEGEIQIDQLLLTSRGLLILEIKDVRGTVFGSDKMSDWTVIANDRRFTFPNPQPGLYDRVAAVRQIVRQVPVDDQGRMRADRMPPIAGPTIGPVPAIDVKWWPKMMPLRVGT